MVKKVTILISLFFLVFALPHAWAGDECLHGVWGSSSNDVFVVGEEGIILHYDGNVWHKMDSGVQNGIAGIWGTSPTNVYAVAWGGVILHYDGSQWSTMLNGELADCLYAIWGSSESDIFAVGWEYDYDSLTGYTSGWHGVILHYDGSLWTRIYRYTGDSGMSWYSAVWGTSSSDVFVDGYDCVLHYNGHTWTKMMSSPTSGVVGFWGSSSSNIYAVEGEGGVYRYNGTNWAVVRDRMYYDAGASGDIWGSSPTNIFIVGDRGNVWVNFPTYVYESNYEPVIFHFNGSSFKAMSYPTSYRLNAVWGSSASDVYAVGGGGTIVHYNGTTWSLVDFTAGNRVSISGDITTQNGTPVCAMALANGQYMFSRDPRGKYNLSVPLDDEGQITLFAFADGFAPLKYIFFTPEGTTEDIDVMMLPAPPDSPQMTLTCQFDGTAENPGWVKISGQARAEDGGDPLCAMVLANGQYTFSNAGNGEYELEVPLNENGQVTLFGFADGFQPYKEVLDT